MRMFAAAVGITALLLAGCNGAEEAEIEAEPEAEMMEEGGMEEGMAPDTMMMEEGMHEEMEEEGGMDEEMGGGE